MSKVTQDRLKEVLHYDSETGIFTWRVSRGRSPAGSVAGTSDRHCLQISVDRTIYKAHRLAWLFVYGHHPIHEIDHINGNPMDNRIQNLRDVPHRVNAENKRKAGRTTYSGLLGAHYHKNSGRYASNIKANGKQICLGYFSTAEEAHAVYVEAKRRIHEGCTI